MPCYLLNLSDDVLLFIIKFVPSCVDIFRLSETCTRMSRICGDTTLWVKVDTRHANPLSLREFRKLLPFLHHKTKSLAIQGFMTNNQGASKTKGNLSPTQLAAVSRRCPQLEELILQDCFVDARRILISMMPDTLTTLRITKCEFVNAPERESYFRGMHESMPKLALLDLSHCGWVTNHSVMAICKCIELREIIFKDCFKIGECFAYTALACRFGFQTVQKIDLRDTSIGDSEVSCFGRLPEVTHLHLGKTTAAWPGRNEGGNSGVTDRGLKSLCSFHDDAHVSKLQHMTLTHLDVTDAVMQNIGTSLPLLHLDLTGTKVTDEGMRTFVRLRPNCKVISRDGEPWAC